MIIFQINSTQNWGSTGRIAEEIGQTIMAIDGVSFIAYGRCCNESASHSIRIGEKVDIYNHVLQTRLFDHHGLASKNATDYLIKQIKKINPDIIHLHNIHGYYLNYKILFDFLSKANIPIVWTLHDCWPFTGHCCHYSFVKCVRWKTGCFNCPQKKSYPSSWFFDRSKTNYLDKQKYFTSVKNMTLVPVSHWLCKEIKESFLRDYPVKVIHNGVNTDMFMPIVPVKILPDIKDKFVILGVASVWSKRKGLADFIKLSYLLEKDEIIVLVGLSKKQMQNLPDNIIGIQRTESIEELVSLYSSADVFLNPTWEDNFPTTNLEALSCGTPVITYKTGGSVEAINSCTGFIVEQGDIGGGLEMIRYIKQVGKLSFSKFCRERVVDFFNKKEQYMQYIQLYKDILKEK